MSATTHSGHTPVTNHSPTGGTTPAPFDGTSEMCVIVLETDELYVFHKHDNEKILNESNYITSLFKQRQAALDAYSQSRDKYAHSLYDNHANNGAPHLTKNEEHVMDQKELALAQAHSHLLNVLLPSFKEDAASKVPGMSDKITEIIVARNIDQGGFKLTWVRSAVLKNHFRRYKLSSADLKTGQKSFITNNKIDTDKLKSQMKDLSVKAKLTIPWLDHWIGKQEVNKAMGNWKAAYNNRPSSSVDVSFSAQAQVLRAGIATEGAGFEYDRKKKQLSAKMDAKIDLTLAEGKVSMVINYPRNGLPLRLGSMDFGPLRASLTISASAGAGATLAFGLGVEVDAKKGTIRGISSTIDNLKSTRPGQVADLKGLPNSGANAEVNAFAGATAEASFSGALEWKTPEKNSIFKPFAMVKPGIAGTAGIGGELALKVTFSDGRFRVFCKAALCFGVGAKGSLAFEVDATVLFQFMYWACCQLGRNYRVDTGIFSPSAMAAIYYISIKAVHIGFENAAKNVYGKTKNWYDQVARELNAEVDRVDLMQKILKNTDFIKYTIPSVKGGMIHALINSSYWARTYPENTGKLMDFRVGSMSTRKQAIMLIFTWVQSKDEFDEIMANIRPTPESPKIPSATGFSRLKTFMAQGEIDALKPKRSTTFENNIQKLYDRLKQHPQPGQPIIKNNMTEYLARSERAPHFPHGHPVDEAQLEETWLAMETTQQRDGGSA